MPLTISEKREAQPVEWDEIWRGCEYATYFHSREWAEIWCQYTGGALRPGARLIRFSDGRRALLALSYEERYHRWLRHYYSAPAGTFGGWISTEALRIEHGRLLTDYLRRRLASLEWRLNPYDPLSATVPIRGRSDRTQVLDLEAGAEAVLRGFSRGHRSAINKARRQGVAVGPATRRSDWEAYFRLYRASLARWGERATSEYGWELFGLMFESKSPRIKLWLAWHQHEPLAGALCFYAPRHAVYWHGAAAAEGFAARPATLLLTEVILDACRQGYRWFDFNPSGGHPGVEQFKARFGARSLQADVIRLESRRARCLRRLWICLHRAAA